MRVPFLLTMLLMLGLMLGAGRIAKKEFGWRIFKMCGTKVEMLRVYETIYSLSAWLKLDCALTMLVLVFGVIYLLPRYEETGELILLLLAVALSLSWLLGAIVSKRFGWRHFWWRWVGLAVLQPGFLVFKIPEIFTYELCRKAHINCTDLQLDTDLQRYEQACAGAVCAWCMVYGTERGPRATCTQGMHASRTGHAGALRPHTVHAGVGATRPP